MLLIVLAALAPTLFQTLVSTTRASAGTTDDGTKYDMKRRYAKCAAQRTHCAIVQQETKEFSVRTLRALRSDHETKSKTTPEVKRNVV
uniref:Putative secreted protein n=1 Tax=Anopheles triannulatus TaxID=58253 RepID=A0A2M4B745_9DIPT